MILKELIDENNKIKCSLLIGKSHLAPVASIAIPRLKFSAAVTAVHLFQVLKCKLSVHEQAT